MGYQGSRGKSPLGQIAAQVVAYLATFVVTFFLVRQMRDFQGFGDVTSLVLTFAGWLVVAIVMHECGHLFVGLAAGEPVRKILIGAGPTLVGFRAGGVTVQICLNVLAGGAVYLSRIGSARTGRLVTVAAGPFVNLVAVIYGFVLYQSGVVWLGGFVLVHALVFVTAIIPMTVKKDGTVAQSDGAQIWNYFFRPKQALAGYEGSELAPDAYAVLAHAGEDAAFAGADEVTDMDMLRALCVDETVGPLLASSGVTTRIPQVAIADSDQSTRPRVSKALGAAITAAVRKCRDMAIPRSSPPAFALGLLLTDCPAGAILKEQGVTEESLLKLLTSRPDDVQDVARNSIISADLPLERWGTAADEVVGEAFRIASVDGSEQVGTEHLLAAIMRRPECRGAQALASLRFVLTWNKAGSAEDDVAPSDGPPVLSQQAGLALAGAIWRTGATQPSGSAEVLLGIVDQSAGIGARILAASGIGPRQLEPAIRRSPRDDSRPCGCTEASRSLWMLRGSARVGAERWLDARSDFLAAERVSTTDGQRALGANNIAWVSLMSGDPGFAAESLEKSSLAVKFKPDQISFQGTHAFALLENGSPAAAATILEEVIPKHGRPRNRASDLCVLAMCRARLGNAEQAAKAIAEAEAADPKCPLLARAKAQLEGASTASALSS